MSYSQWLDRQPQFAPVALNPDDIRASFDHQITDEADLHRHLRVTANQWFAQIIRAEFEQNQSLEIIGAALSEVAAAAVDTALSYYRPQLAERFGDPADEQGNPVGLCALGMGKLGGWELNLSSDIDLIFVHEIDGETTGRKSTTFEDFFARLIKKVTPALDTLTGFGRVFQVDLRLRPWGSAGPTSISRERFESYYEQHGRPWERMAMLRARPLAGDLSVGTNALKDIKPFIYRRYLDFGAIESLRALKALIRQEVAKNSLEDDIKRGAGGIREAEFVVQVQQLIHGGRFAQLQTTRWLAAAQVLQTCLDIDTTQLIQDYRFLRHLEHAIMCDQLGQTHKIPTDPDALERIAQALQNPDWQADLQQVRTRIQNAFEAVVEPETAEPEPIQACPAVLQSQIDGLFNDAAIQRLDDTSTERLNRFVGFVKSELADHPELEQLAPRILKLVATIARRSAYLSLLNESPQARQLLYRLLGTSPWISEQLNQMPAMLDELLDAQSLFEAADPEKIENELTLRLSRITDQEQQLNVLREFKAAHTLRTAATELLGQRAINEASDHLTWTAEAILKAACRLAHQQVQAKHGQPRRIDGDIAVIGYGKLGGLELSYGSDLDLVLIHGIDENAETDGDKPISGQQYLQRWVRNFMQILSVRTTSGVLYEIDMRLRPSGNKGVLVVSAEGYRKYLQGEAWTWERQALVRARWVAGDANLKPRFDQIRHQVLCFKRDADALKQDVLSMRQKMRTHLASQDPKELDIKHRQGGVVDLEFIVQYLALRFALDCPELTRWSDNLRLLETLAARDLMPTPMAQALSDAYLHMRAMSHRLTLGAPVQAAALQQASIQIADAWQYWMSDN